MQLEKWLEEQLDSGALVIRGHQQRRDVNSDQYVGLNVRVYAQFVVDGAPIILVPEVTDLVLDGGLRQRGCTVVRTYEASEEHIQSTLLRLTEDWIPEWRSQTNHVYAVNRTNYPACNPSMTKHLARIQGALEVMASRVDDAACLKITRSLERVLTDAQKELGRNVGFPRS